MKSPRVVLLAFHALTACAVVAPTDRSGGVPTDTDGAKTDDESPATSGSEIVFPEEFSSPRVDGVLLGGSTVTLRYPLSRLLRIALSDENTHRIVGTHYGCFDSAGTCCDFEAAEAKVWFRFDGRSAFANARIAPSGTVSVPIPHGASTLETYFQSDGLAVRAWDCRGDSAQSQANRDAAGRAWEIARAWDNVYGLNYHFAVVSPTTGPSIHFHDIGQAPTFAGEIRPGDTVRVRYDRNRMRAIANSSGGYSGYFASEFHCYGYGCCDIRFPDVGVHSRTSPTAGWIDVMLGEDDTVDLPIGQDASDLEVWFDTQEFEIATWYCGCDAACADANRARSGFNTVSRAAYDSVYGRNYVFPVAR